jgi:hypothetical protein
MSMGRGSKRVRRRPGKRGAKRHPFDPTANTTTGGNAEM